MFGLISYYKFRQLLETVKVRDFKELETLLTDNQKFQKDLLLKDNEITKLKADDEIQFNKQKNIKKK